MLFESEELDKWHKEMNAVSNVPARGFRRNVVVYPLVCYVNNIICCYLSKNADPIPIFIERSRIHMESNPPTEEWKDYYSRINKYIEIMENHLKSNGTG